MWGVKRDITVCFEGLDIPALGILQAIYQRRQAFYVKSVASSGLGVLMGLFVAMNVDPREVEIFLKGSENKVSLSDIYDEFEVEAREESYRRNLVLLKEIGGKREKEDEFIQEYLQSTRLISHFSKVVQQNEIKGLKLYKESGNIGYEQLLNGELAYGQVLLQVIEKFLAKYANNKNITLREFHEVFDVNFIVAATDLTDQSLKLFTHFTAPELPVKYACRMGGSVPFVFPPILWKQKWGTYLGSHLEGHRFISTQIRGALSSTLMHSSHAFQIKYFGARIDPESLLSFDSHTSQKLQLDLKCSIPESPVFKSKSDSWPPFLENEYLQAVGRDLSFQTMNQRSQNKQFSRMEKIPGIRLLLEIIDLSLEMQGKVMKDLAIGAKTQISAPEVGENSQQERRINGDSTEEVRQDTFRFLGRFL